MCYCACCACVCCVCLFWCCSESSQSIAERSEIFARACQRQKSTQITSQQLKAVTQQNELIDTTWLLKLYCLNYLWWDEQYMDMQKLPDIEENAKPLYRSQY